MGQARRRLKVTVQHEWIEVRAVGPHYGPQLVVDANLRKEVWIGKRLEYRTAQLTAEIDITRTAIAEAKPQLVVAEDLCGRDPREEHCPILRQWVDRFRGVAGPRVLPVRFELLAV